MPEHGRLGRLPADPNKPKLKLASLLQPDALLPVPPVVDYLSQVAQWPMFKNDAVGDCTCAAVGHAIETFTTYAQGQTVTITDDDVLAAYEAVSGYNPNDPSTDQGAVVQTVLSYWRKHGVGGDKIVAFASVDVNDPVELATALFEFGSLVIGFSVPQSAIRQFDAGEVWDIIPQHGDGGIVGGHCVNVGYDRAADATRRCVTWGVVQEMTQAFWDRYVDECWVVVTQDWVNRASGMTPLGMDLGAFGAAFTQLTGEPSPFLPAPPQSPSLLSRILQWIRRFLSL